MTSNAWSELNRGDEALDAAPRHTEPLNDAERSAAVACCDRARSKVEAVLFLDMCGLLRGRQP